MLCNWLVGKLLPLDLKSAAWPLSSINQGIVYSCMVQMDIKPCLLLSASELDKPQDIQVMYLCSSCWDCQVELFISFSC